MSGAFRPSSAGDHRNLRAQSPPWSTCTAARCRRSWTAGPMPGSPATARGHGYYTRGNTRPGNATPERLAIALQYPNTQEAAPIWFHDHMLGATRLNVYAGLAGAYLIHDPELTLPHGLAGHGIGCRADHPAGHPGPDVRHQRPALLPGRHAAASWTPTPSIPTGSRSSSATPSWSTARPGLTSMSSPGATASSSSTAPTPAPTSCSYQPGPAHGPADVIDRHRRRLPGPPVGRPDAAVKTSWCIMPGERYEVIVDFAGLPRRPAAPAQHRQDPLPDGRPSQPGTTGPDHAVPRRAPSGGSRTPSYNPATGAPCAPAASSAWSTRDRRPGAGVTRPRPAQLTLNEVMGCRSCHRPVTGVTTPTPAGRSRSWSTTPSGAASASGALRRLHAGRRDTASTTDYSRSCRTRATTEIWEIVNLTADAHPIHLHLVAVPAHQPADLRHRRSTGGLRRGLPDGGLSSRRLRPAARTTTRGATRRRRHSRRQPGRRRPTSKAPPSRLPPRGGLEGHGR